MIFTNDETNLICIYNTGTRGGTINAITEMRLYITEDEKELRELTDSVLDKLGKISDEEYDALELFPEF